MQSLLLRKEVCRDGVNSQRGMMTDLQNNEISTQNSGVTAQQNLSQNNSTANQQSSRFYTDEDVNSILSTKKDKWMEKGVAQGYEKAKAEFMQNNAASQNSFSQTNTQTATSTGLSHEELKQIARQEALTALRSSQEEYQVAYANQLRQAAANQFVSKLEASKKDYPEIERAVHELKLNEHPELWQTANEFDDSTAAGIIHEMNQNVDLYTQALTLKNNPVKLKEKMQQLANSIKQNKEAEAAKKANPPLSRQIPSTVGAESGKGIENMSIKDLKRIFRV